MKIIKSILTVFLKLFGIILSIPAVIILFLGVLLYGLSLLISDPKTSILFIKNLIKEFKKTI